MKANHYTEAAQAVADDLALAEASGECFYTAELHRLRGELSLCPSVARNLDAKASFRRAIAIAKQQGAGTIERRAWQNLRQLMG